MPRSGTVSPLDPTSPVQYNDLANDVKNPRAGHMHLGSAETDPDVGKKIPTAGIADDNIWAKVVNYESVSAAKVASGQQAIEHLTFATVPVRLALAHNDWVGAPSSSGSVVVQFSGPFAEQPYVFVQSTTDDVQVTLQSHTKTEAVIFWRTAGDWPSRVRVSLIAVGEKLSEKNPWIIVAPGTIPF